MITIDVPMPRKCGECPLMDDDSWCRFIGGNIAICVHHGQRSVDQVIVRLST